MTAGRRNHGYSPPDPDDLDAIARAYAGEERVWCDSCGLEVLEPGRWRHAECPVPELGEQARRALDRARQGGPL
jgi:hypothetical protein